MGSLRKSSFLVVFCFGYFMGCTTTSFKVLNKNENGLGVEFLVTPERIIIECERVETDDRGVVYGFMIHIAQEDRKSITVFQGNTLDKESCDLRLKKTNRIVSEGSTIYIAAIGDYKNPRTESLNPRLFPKVGLIYESGHSFQFVAIKNDSGRCYAAYSAEEKPCPPEPFPLK